MGPKISQQIKIVFQLLVISNLGTPVEKGRLTVGHQCIGPVSLDHLLVGLLSTLSPVSYFDEGPLLELQPGAPCRLNLLHTTQWHCCNDVIIEPCTISQVHFH